MVLCAGWELTLGDVITELLSAQALGGSLGVSSASAAPPSPVAAAPPASSGPASASYDGPGALLSEAFSGASLAGSHEPGPATAPVPSTSALTASAVPSLWAATQTVTVQGVAIPLDAPVKEVWAAMAHPDGFLYVVLTPKVKQ